MKKLITLVLLIAVALSLFGCELNVDNGPTPTPTNSLKADKVSIKKTETVNGILKVTVEYNLSSSEQGELMLGCKTSEINNEYEMLIVDVIIDKGVGEYVFTINRSEVWDNDISVELSSYPHQSTWSPLDSAYATID